MMRFWGLAEAEVRCGIVVCEAHCWHLDSHMCMSGGKIELLCHTTILAKAFSVAVRGCLLGLGPGLVAAMVCRGIGIMFMNLDIQTG